MSEYQYYDFWAIDRALTKAEIAELRSVSTRAVITSTSFTNHYEWGDLKADPLKLLEKYFDTSLPRCRSSNLPTLSATSLPRFSALSAFLTFSPPGGGSEPN
jgi:hypothetical protein